MKTFAANNNRKSKYHAVLVFFVFFTFISIVQSPAFGRSGDKLYDQKCGRCHALFSPSDYSAEEWPGLVRSMKSQAALSEQEIDDLTAYLQTETRKTANTSEFLQPVLGGYLYTEYFQTSKSAKNFDIHYLSIYVSGWANDKINYFGEFELEHGGTGGSNTFVEQAYIDFWFRPKLAIKIGAMLTPFNRFDEFHDPLTNFTITRPQLSREIGVSAWKDVGIDFHGYYNMKGTSSITFDLYSINGLGDGSNLRESRQYRDNNDDKAFGGRVNIIFKDNFEIGGSVYNGDWDDSGNLDLTMFGAHLMLKTSAADFYGEYAKATSENPVRLNDGKMSGFFIQASRLIDGKFRPTIRIGKLDYLDQGNLLGRKAADGNKSLNELAFAFSYYPTSKVVFKIEYTLFDETGRAPDKDNDQIGLQAAVKF